VILGIDIDGVLRNFNKQLNEVYIKHDSNYIPNQIKEWDLSKQYPIGSKIYDFLDKNAWEIYEKAPVYDGAKEMLRQLKRRDHRIHLITSAYYSAAVSTATILWLGRNQIPYDLLAFTDVKWHVCAHIYLDDSPLHLNDLARHVGTTVICFTRPWNEGNKNWNGLRADTYSELLTYVEMFQSKATIGVAKS